VGRVTVKFKMFDVRPIIAQGTEPLPEIRAAIEALAPGEGLTISSPFLPAPLIEKLAGEGFRSRVERLSGGWLTHFWRDE